MFRDNRARRSCTFTRIPYLAFITYLQPRWLESVRNVPFLARRSYRYGRTSACVARRENKTARVSVIKAALKGLPQSRQINTSIASRTLTAHSTGSSLSLSRRISKLRLETKIPRAKLHHEIPKCFRRLLARGLLTTLPFRSRYSVFLENKPVLILVRGILGKP